MDTKRIEKDEIIALAKKTKHYCDLLIEQSNNWLSEEEGIKNIEKRISQSENKKKRKRSLGNNNVKIIIGILLSISFASATFSQNIDSLFFSFSQSKSSKRLNTGNEILWHLAEAGHLSQYNPLTEKQPLPIVDATVYGAMALYHSDKGNYVDAILYNEKSLDIYRSMDDSTRIVHRLQNLYVNYASTGQYEKALNCLKESLAIATAIDDQSMIANTLLCMGSLHVHNSNSKLAIELIEKGLKIERQLNDSVKIAWALSSLCTLYLELDRIEDAQNCINEVYSICDESNNIYLKLDCWNSMTLVHQKKEEWDKALAYADSMLTKSVENDFAEYISLSLLTLGNIYIGKKEPEKAEKHLLRCVTESEKSNILENVMMASEKLYILNKTKNATQAIYYLEKSTELYRQLQQEEAQEQLNNFYVQYTTAEKELEIERQQNVIQRQDMHRLVLLTGIIVCSVFLILLWSMLHLRTKRNYVLAEANATKDKFFSIISHDLKNPAIAQRDALQLLVTHSAEWNTDLLSQYYRELLKSADGQVELLYNLLNWAQVQTGLLSNSISEIFSNDSFLNSAIFINVLKLK